MKADRDLLVLSPGATIRDRLQASDPDQDKIEAQWELSDDVKLPRPGRKGIRAGSDRRRGAGASQQSATITAPQKPGPYRVFLFVSDGHNHAATANMPLKVVKSAERPFAAKHPGWMPSAFPTPGGRDSHFSDAFLQEERVGRAHVRFSDQYD